jgi:putative effector of murein hydrolase
MSEVTRAFSALGMGLNGVVTALLMPLMMQIVARH